MNDAPSHRKMAMMPGTVRQEPGFVLMSFSYSILRPSPSQLFHAQTLFLVGSPFDRRPSNIDAVPLASVDAIALSAAVAPIVTTSAITTEHLHAAHLAKEAAHSAHYPGTTICVSINDSPSVGKALSTYAATTIKHVKTAAASANSSTHSPPTTRTFLLERAIKSMSTIMTTSTITNEHHHAARVSKQAAPSATDPSTAIFVYVDSLSKFTYGEYSIQPSSASAPSLKCMTDEDTKLDVAVPGKCSSQESIKGEGSRYDSTDEVLVFMKESVALNQEE